ncbi:MAG: NAD-dependent succinate-semialdehyde dehydrogenase [Phycisphaerae bacterium]|nr:NAD-dependent succinate-semialdehyde dehydrogenase [Phycisphaerae bacterium]
MIESPLLTPCMGYVAGKWQAAKSGSTVPVHNPATGEHLADVPDMGKGETLEAIGAAASSLETPLPRADRRRALEAIAAQLIEHREPLARIITQEHGKPLAEARAEVEYSSAFYSHFAGQLDRLGRQELDGRIRGCRWTIHHRPAGVAGLITPWNFPLAMFSKKLSAAVAAGCGVVVRPASLTPLSAIAFWRLAERAGLPPGMLNLVLGRSGPIGEVLCEHPAVRVISFTGSTDTGQILLRQTSPHIKRVAMELGGNAPFIVFDDADLTAAADALVANKFRCGGQTCVCANRVYVHKDVGPRFNEILAERVAALKVGNGLDDGVHVGPLINRFAFDKVAEHVRDALARGADRVVGYDPPRPEHDWGCFYPPTLLGGARPDMLVFQQETFGPVVAVATFESEDEVLRLANDTRYGLAAYVFTRDPARGGRCAERLSFGHVGINTGTGPAPEAPFGGMKQSGFGREGGVEGLLEFCEPQTVVEA